MNSVFGYNVYALVGININTRKTSEVIDNLKKSEEVIINKAVINDDKNPLVIYTKVSQKIKSTGI